MLNRLIPGEKALPMQLGDKMGMLLEKTDGSGEKDGVQSVGNAGVNFPDLGGAASKSVRPAFIT